MDTVYNPGAFITKDDDRRVLESRAQLHEQGNLPLTRWEMDTLAKKAEVEAREAA